MLLLFLACVADPAPRPSPADPETGTDSVPPSDSAGTPTLDSTPTDPGDDTGPPPGPCADRVDNDGDAWVDLADPDCATGAEVGYGSTGCNDGLDNDLDGDVDGYDDDCDAAVDDEADPGLVGEIPLAAADLVIRGTGADEGVGGRVAVASDLDGDGVGEVLATVSVGGAGELRWYAGDLVGAQRSEDAEGIFRPDSGTAPIGAVLTADVDGDGDTDLLLGSPDGDGAVYLFAGPRAPGITTTGSADGTLLGVAETAQGSALAWVADLSGDGADDLLVGAFDGGLLAASVVPGPLTPGSTDLGDLGQRVYYEEVGDGGSGGALGAADFDGDGVADLVVGAPGADDVHADHGKVYVLPGPVQAQEVDLHYALGTWVGEDAHHSVGKEVWVSADVNTDGHPDLFVGMGGNDSFGTVVDRAYLVYDPVVRGDTSLADAAVIFEGDEMFDGVGHPLAAPGDVDGDGRADVLLSASGSDRAGRDAGLAYLFYGAISPGTYLCERARATFIGEAPDGAAGAALAGGDLDGDGFADLVISAPALDLGAVYVFRGKER